MIDIKLVIALCCVSVYAWSWPPNAEQWDGICLQLPVSEEVQQHIASHECLSWFIFPVNAPGTAYHDYSPLHICAIRGNLDLMRRLISRYGYRGMLDVLGPGCNYETPLYHAIYHKHYALAEYLLGMGASPKAKNDFGDTCLHVAAKHGGATIVGLLLAYGAPVASEGSNAETPLHVAASAGNIAAIKILLKHGALKMCFKANQQCGTPLHVAVLNDEMKALKYLVEHGAPIDVVCEDGESALQVAQQQFGSSEMVEYLSNPPSVSLNPPTLQFLSCTVLWCSVGNMFWLRQLFDSYIKKLKNLAKEHYFNTLLVELDLVEAKTGAVSTESGDAQKGTVSTNSKLRRRSLSDSSDAELPFKKEAKDY